MNDDDIVLYEGTALRLDEAFQLTNAFCTRVVLVMGEKRAGKTTLLAEIHNLYLARPYAGYLFAGSKTLIGFEERCFLSRVASGRTAEDTERTKYADVRLLHLALAAELDPGTHTHLLLTDVSGERFKDIRQSVDEAKEMAPLIRCAEHVVLLVDGDQFTIPETQMFTESNTLFLLRCLLEEGGLKSARSLDVVVTKWDYVVDRDAEEDVKRLIGAIERITNPHIVPRFHRVAARSSTPEKVPASFGIEGLIQGWMEKRYRPVYNEFPEEVHAKGERYYYRYCLPMRASLQ